MSKVTIDHRKQVRTPYHIEACEILKRELKRATTFEASRVHIQKSNSKTGAIGEGTLPGATCIYGGIRRVLSSRDFGVEALPVCFWTCYAQRDRMTYPGVLACQIRNTVQRELDPVAYYETFAKEAIRRGTFQVRINESGDFSDDRIYRAFLDVARRFRNVIFWGYTQTCVTFARPENLPENVIIRFSTWNDENLAAALEGSGVPTAVVVEKGRGNCPAQKAAARGEKWTCANCAANGCGCLLACRMRQKFDLH